MDLHGYIPSSSQSFLLAMTDGHLIKGPDGFVFPAIPSDIIRYVQSRIFLGMQDTVSLWVAGISPDVILSTGYSLHTLRDMMCGGDDTIPGIACRAIQLVRFDSLTRFCGYCSSRTEMKSDEIAKVCTSCKRIVFPRLSPAVIVRITDNKRILLSRSPHFPNGMYSVQAGFVEPGESLEAAAIREVREEIGIEISGLTYFGSQPWPFPDSLMIGFTAEYAGGEIACDEHEIEDAQWFLPSDLPALPGNDSIARALILDWLEK
jgi:NAD+ diphosphatase